MIGGSDGYLFARKNLLRALLALSVYSKEAVVVVGAQAVYLQCQFDDLPFPPFTLDSDLAIDPRMLDEVPPIRRVLESQGYRLRVDDQPGLYRGPQTDAVLVAGSAVDILVPEEFAIGASRRDANLPGDNARAARRTAGLEAALYDKDLRTIQDPDDLTIHTDAYVAGPVALIFAKAQKIAERSVDRVSAKDAADVYRLLRAYDAASLGERVAALRQVPEIGNAVNRGTQAAREVFVEGTRGRTLFATILDEADRTEFLASYDALVQDLGRALR